MTRTLETIGIHHITAIASSATENLAFYENVLGLRLVKKTVNFDDPYTYHLYYGDASGSPGTIVTFFPWERLPRGRAGAGMVTALAFSIPVQSVAYWQKRLNGLDIASSRTERFGDPLIQFGDPHGLALELIATSGAVSPPTRWSGPIPPEHRIGGLHSATALLHSLEKTRFLLVDLLGMRPVDRQGNRYRFKMGGDSAKGRIYDVIVDPSAENGRHGGGSVHHIAFRTPTEREQKSWRKRLMQSGFSVTPVRDRKYFKSIYFHEPGGVLFEIATDPPGFAVDEPHERLGRDLKLPQEYEPMRDDIESRLSALQPKDFIDRYMEPVRGRREDMTLVK